MSRRNIVRFKLRDFVGSGSFSTGTTSPTVDVIRNRPATKLHFKQAGTFDSVDAIPPIATALADGRDLICDPPSMSENVYDRRTFGQSI